MNEVIIKKFYEAFKDLDAETMISCYHNEIEFEDPAFGKLKGEYAKYMWQMLCESQKGKDFKVTFSDVKAHNLSGSAHWEAFYTFSKTQRKVHNKIDASFEFKDGYIIKHKDNFNLHNWAKQAFGFKGWLLSFMPFFKGKLNQQTNTALEKFRHKKKLPR